MAWVRGFELLPESRRDCLGVLGVDWNCPGKLGKYINHGKKVPRSTALFGDTLQIGKVGLPLSIDTRHICIVLREPTARRLVQRMGLFAP